MAARPDEYFMRAAIEQAGLAAAAGEVPVGAVVVHDGQIVGAGRNHCIGASDPGAHAEMLALQRAARHLGNYRLNDCELFVTLEPCAMCVGAALHARLRRVVFGSADPKTGAAGSVINLFDNRQLNHQTQVQGGVLGAECSVLLRTFFQDRREEMRMKSQIVREDALRTPDGQFDGLPDYPWAARYLSDLPALDGLRLHYLDEGNPSASLTYLCLHGNPAWSYVYRKMIPVFLADGKRVVAPDLIGFGKSDKPKKDSFHTFTWHRQVLLEFIERLNLKNIILVVQDWGGLLGLTLPMQAPGRYAGLLVMNTALACGDTALSPGFLAWRDMCANKPDFDIGRLFARGNPQMSAAECAAYQAPFPDSGHRAATRAFPAMVPDTITANGAPESRLAREFWQTQWSGQSLMAVGVQDPVLGLPVMQELRTVIRGCPPPMLLDQAGHFVPEQGEDVAHAAVKHFVPRS